MCVFSLPFFLPSFPPPSDTCLPFPRADDDEFSIISRLLVLAVEEATLRSIEAAGGHWQLDLTSRKGHVTQEHPPLPPTSTPPKQEYEAIKKCDTCV